MTSRPKWGDSPTGYHPANAMPSELAEQVANLLRLRVPRVTDAQIEEMIVGCEWCMAFAVRRKLELEQAANSTAKKTALGAIAKDARRLADRLAGECGGVRKYLEAAGVIDEHEWPGGPSIRSNELKALALICDEARQDIDGENGKEIEHRLMLGTMLADFFRTELSIEPTGYANDAGTGVYADLLGILLSHCEGRELTVSQIEYVARRAIK